MKGQGWRLIGGLGAEKDFNCTLRVVLAKQRLESLLCFLKNMPKAAPKLPASYESALEELDQLVGLIESGQLPLEQLLTGYQRGAELLAYCRSKLETVEQQIKVLDDGILKPWTQ